MLDASTADEVRHAILEATDGRTLVIADHHFEPWVPYVDRVVLLGPQARILADDSPQAVLAARPELRHRALPRRGDRLRTPADTPLDPVLRLSDVSVARRRRRGGSPDGGGAEPPLLQGLDLALVPGSLTVVTGPSGAGKTTLLRVVTGLAAPSAGTIHRPRAEQIAFVPQEPEHSFVARTVREEISASPWVTDPRLAESVLRRAGLEHLADAQPFTLSGGEQRRLAIAAALAQEPRLLVLDEPTVGLDLHTRGELVALVNRAQDLGCTVLVASHDRDLLTIADHHLDLAAHVTPPIGSDADNAPLTSTPATPSTRILPVRAGRAVPTDRLNPLTMCVLAVAAAVGSAGVTTWQVGLPALAVTLGMLPLTMRNIRGAALRLLPVTIAALGLWWSTMLASPGPTFSGDSFLLGFKEALRILYFVAPGVLLLTSLDPTALGDALGGRLRLPGRPVATVPGSRPRPSIASARRAGSVDSAADGNCAIRSRP
jgi:energy-coupling factor transport system ATP-binding protein